MISYFVPIEKVYTKTIDKIHWTSLYAISISVAFFVVERIIALIFVKTYEHFNKNLPILGMVFSIISWSVSASFQLLYKFKIVNDFHTILFTGSLQIIIIICYVLFFFYKIFKLKKNIDHSLSKRYQEEENLKSASLLKYILSFTVLAATYNIVFYIIYVRYNFYKYGGGFSLLTFQVPQLIQVMTTAIVILIQQRVFYRIFIKIAIILCKSNKVCIEDKHYSLQKSRINAIDLSGNSERTNVYFNSLQSVWKLNKTT